ncbi:MAG TPA: TonB-dependent receptor [Steroidobacteraceae bacterium]
MIKASAGAVTLIGAVIWTGLAQAQTVAPATSATTSGNALEEIVVTAQRRAQNIEDVPVSVQVVSNQALLAAGIKSTQDLGQLTPNVTIISPIGQGNQPLITIRGIGLNDFDTNNAGPNGVYIDDVYINAPSAQSFALFDLQGIQVLKGPQGTLYGRNTSGGALVFTSNRPTEEYSSDMHIEYGNFNTSQLVGGVGGPLAQGLTGRISLVVNRSDGYFKNAFTGDNIDNISNEAFRAQLQYKPNDQLTVYWQSLLGYVDNHPTPYGHIGTYVPGTQGEGAPSVCSPSQAFAGGCVDLYGYPTSAVWSGSFNRLQNLTALNSINQFRVDYEAGPATLTAITSYQYNDKYHPEETDASPNDLLSATYGVRSKTVTQEFRVAHNSETLNWVGGLFLLDENLRQNQPLYLFAQADQFGGFGIPPGPGAFDGIAQRSYDSSRQLSDSAALFGQGDYSVAGFTFTLGARYTWERKKFDYHGSTQYQAGGMGNYGPLQDFIDADESQSNSNVTWRAAVAYHFTQEAQAYASASSGFKSGGFNGSFLSNNQEQALLQLSPIRPEHVSAFEVGEKATFLDRRLGVTSAVFYNDYRDEQIFATVPQVLQTGNGQQIVSTTQLLTNAKHAHTEGVELQITTIPIHGLTIDLQPAYLQAKLDHAGLTLFSGVASLDGKQLANAPHLSFSGVVSYKYDVGDGAIDFRLNSNYRSHVWFDSTNDPYIQQAGYWLHNLNVSYESGTAWEAGIFVRNLADKKYALTSTDLSSPFGLLEPVYGAPRMFGVQFTYHH